MKMKIKGLVAQNERGNFNFYLPEDADEPRPLTNTDECEKVEECNEWFRVYRENRDDIMIPKHRVYKVYVEDVDQDG